MARADVREVPVEDAATRFHEIEVEVVDADGAPAREGRVFALPTGAPGTDDEDMVPNAYVRDGRCRLVVPSPALLDVVATRRYVLMRIEDVRVPAQSSLRIRLPTPPIATFVLDPDDPPAGDVSFSIQAVRGPGHRLFPARGEPWSPGSSWGGMVGPGHPRHEMPLGPIEFMVREAERLVPSGNGFTHQPPEHPAVFEPERFVPPATVRVRGPTFATLEVALTISGGDEGMRVDRRVAWRLDFDGSTLEGSAWFAWDGSGPARITAKAPVRTATGTLRWSGPRLVPGAVPWDLARSARVEAAVEVRPVAPADGVRVLVDLSREEAVDEGRVFLYFPQPHNVTDTPYRALVPVGTEVVLEASTGWLLADVDRGEGPLLRRVAGPVRVDRGSRVTMTPRRGGFVVFAPASVPPGEGAMVVGRADGAPFPYTQRGDDRHACLAALQPGDVLGPFEPGVVTLDVFVGGRRWGRYEVTVREGDWTPFAPRPFR